jgi:hypothetical protein
LGKLRNVMFCFVLGFGSLLGVPMCPEEIEALMANMNKPKIAHVLPDEDFHGDDPAGGPPRSEN